MGVVVLADVTDRLGWGDAVEDRQASQCRTRPALAAGAGHLHPLGCGAPPQLDERLAGILAVGR